MHYRSLAFRATTSLTLSVLFFALAIGLWSYQSDRLGISADVTTTGNQVKIDFDELTTPGPRQYMTSYTLVRNQYQNYGVKLTSDPLPSSWILKDPSGGILKEYDPATVLTTLQLLDPEPRAAFRTKLVIPSGSNAIAGAYPAYYTVKGQTTVFWPVMNPKAPIIMNFVDPANPANTSPTNHVQFALSVDADTWCTVQLCQITKPRGVVKVSALNASGTVLVTRNYSSTGTYSVDLSATGITKVRIEGDGLSIAFILDDLTFTMPASSVVTSASLTTNKSSYPSGETVIGTFANTGTTTITCPKPLFPKIYNSSGAVVVDYSFVDRRLEQSISPGSSVTVTWNQKDSAGKQVPAGNYTMQVDCGSGVSKQATFTIEPPIPPAGTLSTSKATYQVNETVSFTFTNTGKVAISCPSEAPWSIIDASGAVVFAPQAAKTTTNIPIGGSKTWTWNQKKANGTSVAPGTYSVTVSCTDIVKSASFTIASIQVTNLDFTVTPTSGTAPLTVTVTYSGSETCLAWDFGDGTVVPNASPVERHTYLNAGTYTVTLRSCAGATGSKQVTVTAAANPTPTPSSTSSPTGSGPSITKKTPPSFGKLVSTGGSLAVNLAIAAILSGLVTYMLVFRRRPEQDK